MSENKKNILENKEYPLIGFLAIFTLLFGTVFYHIIEKLSWVDSWYFSVITLATVGYGDIAPKTDLGKLFTTIYVLIGIGIIVAFTSTLVKRGAERRERKREEKSEENK